MRGRSARWTSTTAVLRVDPLRLDEPSEGVVEAVAPRPLTAATTSRSNRPSVATICADPLRTSSCSGPTSRAATTVRIGSSISLTVGGFSGSLAERP